MRGSVFSQKLRLLNEREDYIRLHVKYSLSCWAAILMAVNVNQSKCLFIRHSFFVFFGTACLRSLAQVGPRKEQSTEGVGPSLCVKRVNLLHLHTMPRCISGTDYSLAAWA